MTDTLAGGCYCGRVRYQVPVAAVRFGFGSCHCSMCRRMHGAPFVMWGGLSGDQAAQLTVTGEPAAFAASAAATRFFCPTCGTHTHLRYADGAERWSGEVHFATATLDDASVPILEAHMAATNKPRHVHVFYSDRAACLGDPVAWANAPRFGGTTGTEKLSG